VRAVVVSGILPRESGGMAIDERHRSDNLGSCLD
jgi:hypothetical protein